MSKGTINLHLQFNTNMFKFFKCWVGQEIVCPTYDNESCKRINKYTHYSTNNSWCNICSCTEVVWRIQSHHWVDMEILWNKIQLELQACNYNMWLTFSKLGIRSLKSDDLVRWKLTTFLCPWLSTHIKQILNSFFIL